MGEAVALLTCVFGPAAISVLIHHWAGGRKAEAWEMVLAYAAYVFAILMLSCAVIFLRGHGGDSLYFLFGSTESIVKYGTVSLVFAVLLPNALLLLKAAVRRIWQGRGNTHG